jgi:hypothetical protein
MAEFVPTVAADGSLDPGPIADASVNEVAQWLRGRLSGNDPWVPISVQLGEDPAALVAALVSQRSVQDEAVQKLGLAANQLLADLPGEEIPRWTDGLLSLCARERLPHIAEQMDRLLDGIVASPEGATACWGTAARAAAVLRAARKQHVPLPDAEVYAHWLSLLESPDFGTLALASLAVPPHAKIRHLPVWWRYCPESARSREIEAFAASIARQQAPDTEIQTALAASGLPLDLRRALTDALARCGVRARCERNEGPHASMLLAAQRRDVVLQDAAG